MPFWRTPSGCRGASCEILRTIIGQRASILGCLDRPIENALLVVKTGGKIGEDIGIFWPLTNSIFVLWSQTTVQSFIKCDSKLRPQERWQTDRQTERRCQRSYSLSQCYAIAMGQIKKQSNQSTYDIHYAFDVCSATDGDTALVGHRSSLQNSHHAAAEWNEQKTTKKCNTHTTFRVKI